MLMPRSISTASVSLLARQPCWTLLTSFVLGLWHWLGWSGAVPACEIAVVGHW
jgi:hypothetical protein